MPYSTLSMKKKIIATYFICMALIACNGKANHEKEGLVDTGPRVSKKDTPRITTVTKDTSRKEAINHAVSDKIVGIWAFVGDENATFVIAKDKITYPDQNASYRYVLKNDSIHIKFDGYDGNYLVKTIGTDTLVLAGDDQQVYYRFKK